MADDSADRPSVEQRLAQLEARLQVAEDRLAILDLLNSYGPLVDSGSAREAPLLWTEGGGYHFTRTDGVTGRFVAPAELEALYEREGHMHLVNTGASHLTATPRITVSGDEARAVGYSFVIARQGESWIVWRAAINEWTLVRTPAGWRIAERYNRVLDGSPESHELMRRVLTMPA